MPQTILKPYLLSFLNRLRRTDHSNHSRRRDISLLVMSLMIMLCIYSTFAMILYNIKDNPLFLELIPIKLIQLLFYAFFVILVLSNTVAAVGNIYNSNNMNFLLYVPVSGLRLYFSKVVEMLAESSFMLVVFAIPTSLAFYTTLDLSFEFLLSLVLLTPAFLLIPIGPAVVLASVFVRFASVFWKRGTFLLVVGAMVSFYVVLRLILFFTQVSVQRGGTKAILEIAGFTDNPNPMWLPSRWASEIVQVHFPGFGSGFEPVLPQFWSLLYLAAFISLSLGFLTWSYFVERIRSLSVNHLTEKNTESDIGRTLVEKLAMLIPVPSHLRAIVVKDFSSLLRDRSMGLQLLMFLGVSLAYLVLFKLMTRALNLGGPGLQLWQASLSSFNVLFTGFILIAVMTRLVYPSLSLEGRSFWVLLVTPIDLRELVEAKFASWLPLVALLSVSLLGLGSVAVNLSLPETLCMMVFAACLAYGSCGLAIGLGATYASFEWESPNQLSAGFGTLVLLGAGICFVALISVLGGTFSLFTLVEGLNNRFGEPTVLAIRIVSIAIAVVSTIFIARYSKRKGARILSEKVIS